MDCSSGRWFQVSPIVVSSCFRCHRTVDHPADQQECKEFEEARAIQRRRSGRQVKYSEGTLLVVQRMGSASPEPIASLSRSPITSSLKNGAGRDKRRNCNVNAI